VEENMRKWMLYEALVFLAIAGMIVFWWIWNGF